MLIFQSKEFSSPGFLGLVVATGKILAACWFVDLCFWAGTFLFFFSPFIFFLIFFFHSWKISKAPPDGNKKDFSKYLISGNDLAVAQPESTGHNSIQKKCSRTEWSCSLKPKNSRRPLPPPQTWRWPHHPAGFEQKSLRSFPGTVTLLLLQITLLGWACYGYLHFKYMW